MSIITKRAFMNRCHISAPTCYKWIKKNKDGLSAYVREDGIDDALFDLPAWSKYKSDDDLQNEQTVIRLNESEQEVERLRSEIERLQTEHKKEVEDLQSAHESEVERLKSEHLQEVAGLRIENEKLQTQVGHQEELLTVLNDQMKIKDTQISQLHVLIGQKSLPKPRRTFLEWLGVKKSSENV